MKFDPEIRAAVLTASDTRTKATDESGTVLVGLLLGLGIGVAERVIVPDEFEQIRDALISFADDAKVDLILTTGGTGFAGRDVTPEATRAVIDREAPGIAEAIRRETAANTKFAMLSRAVAGIRGKTLIVNLPGSPKGVRECFAVFEPVLIHALKLIRGETGH
ncbi:MAG TPA: MogA/MoaB family molybdenum cofactor biosynthesis protein [Pyrinomonadaceae bacterium]|nr:MogA/MoaB family molybdenum cofactor biosynthesis protein [Pyrinomonadaceae bacterium]